GDDVQEPAAEEVVPEVVPPSPSSPVIPSSPPHQPPCPPQPQDAEGSSLLFQVKKLEKINKVKSSKLRRLKKVGTSQRVESSDDVENVFNQGRMIVDMDQDEGIELVTAQEKDVELEGRHADIHAEIYNIDLDHSSKVLSMQEDDTEVAAASTSIPTAKPAAPTVSTRRRKGVVLKYDEILPIFQAKFDANMRFLFKSKEEMEKEDEEIIKSINETLAQKAAKRRKLSEEAQEANDLRKRLEIIQDEDDDIFVKATPLAQKTMFEEPDRQDAIWRNQKSVHGLALVKRWKLLTLCGVHVITLSTVQLFLLVERRYPLSRLTLEQLVNVARLQVEEESEISLELLSHSWIRRIGSCFLRGLSLVHAQIRCIFLDGYDALVVRTWSCLRHYLQPPTLLSTPILNRGGYFREPTRSYQMEVLHYVRSLEEPQTPPAPQDEDEHEPMFIQPHDLDFMLKPIYPEYIPLEDEHVLSTEEKPLPPVVSPTAELPEYVAESDPEEDPEEDESDDEDEEEEEEEHLAPADFTIVIPTYELAAITFPLEAKVERLLAMPTPSPSPVTSLSPPSAGERLARYTTPAALPSPPLPPPLHMPPPVDRRDDILEIEMPPRKRLCLSTLGSSTLDAKARRRGIREVGYGIRDTWVDPTETVPEIAPMTAGEVNIRVTELVELHEHDTQDLYALLEDAQDSRTHISQRVTVDSQRVDLLMEDRIAHQETI
nr:hypothetical protein [Tanacetum cinerariifolium]